MPSLANMPWWEFYQDEELQKLIRIALAENKDLERTVATIEEYETVHREDRLYSSDDGHVELSCRKVGWRPFSRISHPFNYYLQGNLV